MPRADKSVDVKPATLLYLAALRSVPGTILTYGLPAPPE
jgi:hypothetical protein